MSLNVRMDPDQAPGWDAIDGALRRLYPAQEPLHFAPPVPPNLGGKIALHGISAYRAANPAHWHFVTYGLTELFTKESQLTDRSGWGFELTFRLVASGPDQPPAWALRLLAQLATYVSEKGTHFAPGHRVDNGRPIVAESGTRITAIAFTPDPQLEAVDSPHGRFSFLQIVGVTADELDFAKRARTATLLTVLADRNPLFLTDLNRHSILDDPEVRSRAEGLAKES